MSSDSDNEVDAVQQNEDELADSSALDSLSDATNERSPHIVTQKDVFGSDTESNASASSSRRVKQRAEKRRVEVQSDLDELQNSTDDERPGGKYTKRANSRTEGVRRRQSVDSGSSLSDADIEDDHDLSGNPEDGESEEAEEVPRRQLQQQGSSPEQSDSSGEQIARSPTGSSGRMRTNRSSDEEGQEEGEASDHVDEEHHSEEEGDQEPDEARIAVDFPLIRADLGKDIYLVKMPNFLSVETRPFDPNYYEDELDEDEVLDEEGRTRLKLKVENTIRWRYGKTPEGEVVHESNSRIVRWSDGSLSLHLGDEIFDIHTVDIHSDYNYLFIREGSGLQGQSSLRTKLTFRPHSTDSFTHRKITLSLADKTNKSQKVKILPVAGGDPESNRNDLIRKEEEKLRAALRRENKLRRMRERQAMTRSIFGSERRRSYADEDDEDMDEDDGNTTSINALKRNAKASLIASRKEVSAVYSETESESLSDLSESKSRKKIRPKIIDEEEEETD